MRLSLFLYDWAAPPALFPDLINSGLSHCSSYPHGQSVSILGLPKDTGYTVTEDSYAGDGYHTSCRVDGGQATDGTAASGVISADTVSEVAFTNTKNVSVPNQPTKPVEPTKPVVPVKPTEPQTPVIPQLPIDKVTDPNLPDSPDTFVLIDGGGTPLGTYHKEKQPDGSYLYLDEEGVPLGEKEIPVTGDEAHPALWFLTAAGSLSGIVWLMRPNSRRREIDPKD